MTTHRLPTYFISHGGGPWPYMDDLRKKLRVLEVSLKDIPRQIAVVPKAVLVISGHWEEDEFTVMANPHPPMVYDYSGFPEHTYHVKYPAPGSPQLAQRVRSLIEAAGMPARLDPQQGFDHGTFTPLVIMYPEADVPVVELSMKSGYDPAVHLKVGEALAPLRDEGVLIIASGNIIHNLAHYRQSEGTRPDWALDFQARSNAAILSGDHDALTGIAPDDRAAALAINSGEHFLPLLYTLGSRQPGDGVALFNDTVDGALSMTSVLIGDPSLLHALEQTLAV